MLAADDGSDPPVKDEAEKRADSPRGHLPPAHDPNEPREVESLKGFALVGKCGGGHSGEGGVMTAEAHGVAAVSSIAEYAGPERAGRARRARAGRAGRAGAGRAGRAGKMPLAM